MMRGFGVSIVAEELAKRMSQFGWDLYVGTIRVDGNFSATPTFLINPDAQEILKFCREWNIEVVLAQTTPYFEVLPHLVGHIPVIVYEHGDPTPAFFAGDGAERERIRQYKIQNVYPVANKVLASSHFLVQDIEWPAAEVVTLGCNHVPDFGLKRGQGTIANSRPLRVGTLMRLGAGEAQYKGNGLFRELVAKLRKNNDDIEFCVMGRGTESDGDEWREIGVTPILNAPDEAKVEYLRGLDIFISPSMWEGFNLPIVEAQALGTVGIGFDAGAHPETALHLASSLDDAVSMIEHWNVNRQHLNLACERAYAYVRSQFDWDLTAQGIAQHCDSVSSTISDRQLVEDESTKQKVNSINDQKVNGRLIPKLLRVWRREGTRGTVRLVLIRMKR
jgi:glycosyltransferase involved in cell wall biosynthesis